jgi:hypothetical protein
MPSLKQYFNRRLSARETIAVVAILALLAGLGYVAYQFITAKLLEARVNEAVPKVRADIRDQRGKLVNAIEAYKRQFGVYPPDHVLSRQPLVVDAVTNSLFYELVGTIYNPTNKMFQVGGLEPAEARYVKEFFQCDGFRNCAETADKIKRFLTIDPLPARQLHDDPDVFAVGFQVPYEGLAPEVVWEFEVSPWRYVSSSPTNNPGKFDLWIELKTKSRTVVIGNWKPVE